MKKSAILFFSGVLALASAAAGAQVPVTFAGTLVGLEGGVITVKTPDGDKKIKLAEKFRVDLAKKITVDDIKTGDFVGPATRKRPDGKLEVISLQHFPAALRGVIPEGYREFPQGIQMTNATVVGMVRANNSHELTLEYPGGSKTMVVPENVPMYTTSPSDASILSPGVYVRVPARQGPDGMPTSGRVIVSTEGELPKY
jgi:hypothetical protein